MCFILSQSDIQEIVMSAQYRADMSQHRILSELFRNNRYIRNLLGRLIHVAANCHFDPGSITTYSDVIEEYGYVKDEAPVVDEHLQYIIHEIYLSLRSTIDPWIDRGWLYETIAIDVNELDVSMVPLGFSILPLVSPRTQCQHSDLFSPTALIDFLNTKTY